MLFSRLLTLLIWAGFLATSDGGITPIFRIAVSQ